MSTEEQAFGVTAQGLRSHNPDLPARGLGPPPTKRQV